MKILVYGAGPLGSLFASKLHQSGHEVALLARGQRLSDLIEHGIELIDTQTGQKTVTHPQIVERLDSQDTYDLVLVIMRKNRALEILPILAVNQHTPNILFLMNNAAGPGELVEALGAERVLMGFPMAAGYRRGHVVYYMAGNGKNKARIPIGEVNGQITPRLREIASILASMDGFETDLRTDMDAWLKTHVALLMPSLAPAMRAAGRDNLRMAHTRDAIVLAIRAIREGFRVLRALGVSITPTNILIIFGWIPEPILVWQFQKRLVDPRIRIAMLEHAEAAQDEIKYLADEFMALKHQTSIPTPAIDHLYAYFDPNTPLIPEGMAEIPLDWRPLGMTVGIALSVMAIGLVLLRRRR